jgi:ribosome-associated protein
MLLATAGSDFGNRSRIMTTDETTPNDSEAEPQDPGAVGQPDESTVAEDGPPDESFDSEVVNLPRDEDLYERSLANAVIAAKCADEMRAKDVVVLDMTKIASIVDFFVIATGTSRRQMHAIADEVNRKIKGERGNTRLSIEGYRTEGHWILMDFGDVVLHVFTEEGRQLYDLENLKADAERVDWRKLVGLDESGRPS